MIKEHEIPNGSRLYFGSSAKLKREIEAVASEILEDRGFEEIVTPFFSYHQHKTLGTKEIIRFSDESNNLISLRADSTQDVVRLLTKRLGRSIEQKKWFYIQPVFRYPSLEINQIGAEFIGSDDLVSSIEICGAVFKRFNLQPLLHVSNIKIPQIISNELGLDLGVFERGELQKILSMRVDWLDKLASLQSIEEIEEVLKVVPESIKVELEKMRELARNCSYESVCLSPLYYVKMRYYDELYFRFIYNNSTLAKGGTYKSEGLESSGFGIYTDALIENLTKEKI